MRTESTMGSEVNAQQGWPSSRIGGGHRMRAETAGHWSVT